jgi:hypothetical protein
VGYFKKPQTKNREKTPLARRRGAAARSLASQMSTAATMTTPQAAEFSRFLLTQLGQKELPCMKIPPIFLHHTPCNKA